MLLTATVLTCTKRPLRIISMEIALIGRCLRCAASRGWVRTSYKRIDMLRHMYGLAVA